MSNRPNYILELKDGRTIEFVPMIDNVRFWVTPKGQVVSLSHLKALGATPVPQPKPKMVWQLVKFWIQGDSPDWANNHKMGFASIEDAENYRLRCESIGPEWTDWEPEDGQKVRSSITICGIDYPHFAPTDTLDSVFKRVGILQPTKERRDEWLDRFGKAWGLK